MADNSAKAASAVLAHRELCRRRLLPFVEQFQPGYDPGWMHRDICSRLEAFSDAVAAGESPRLMLFCPPRHGKSTLAARCLPAWHLGRNPRHEFIICSYGDTLANRHSRVARDIVSDPVYGRVFPGSAIDKRTTAVDEWRVKGGGGMVAAGVNTGITGKGAHILVVDDPIKDRKEADSPGVREDCWDWYASTAYTRLAPGAGVLVIQTRWHVDDLAGRLLQKAKDGEGEQFEVVLYQAIAEVDEKHRKKGEALHPSRYPIEALEQKRLVLPDRDWIALYQQKPSGDDGAYFKRADFTWYDRKDSDYSSMRHYQAWDLAIGQKEENDYTVGVDVAVDSEGYLNGVEIMRGKWRSDEVVEKMIDFCERWKPEMVGVESGHIELTMGPWLSRRIRERRVPMVVEPLRTRGRDKFSRASSMQAAVQHGRMRFPKDDPDWTACVNEMIRFGGGAQDHDDQVDALAWIGLMLDNIVSKARRPGKRERDTVQEMIRKHMRRKRGGKADYSAMSA